MEEPIGKTISNEKPELKEFKNRWLDVDTTLPVMTLCFTEEILINMRYEIINCILDILTNRNSKNEFPRDDYLESAELALIMLGCKPLAVFVG